MSRIIEGSVSHRLAVQEEGREASSVWGLEMLRPGEVHLDSDCPGDVGTLDSVAPETSSVPSVTLP